MLNLLDEDYDKIKKEIYPFIARQVKKDGQKLYGIKLLERDESALTVLAISSTYGLWRFKLKFSQLGEWETNVIQSSARMDEKTDLNSLKQKYMNILGMTAKEANQAVLEFYVRARTFREGKENVGDNF